ncbi:MAG: uncharacterized membrane protein YebE (DUF533 family) [Cellvibrionaceae bacterium]|jgi:uncharacterized membrane protein YebE (DUF533 family)
MVDVNKLLGSFLSSGAATGFAGGLAGGMASKMISGKTVKKMGSSALKLGGVAAVGALAYTAYKRYNNNQGSAPSVATATLSEAPEDSAFLPAPNDQAASDALGLLLVRAMIAVARADGRLDAQESQAIFQRIESLGLDSESQNLLVQEMGHPVDMDAIISSASCPEMAAEIYIASLLAVDVDTVAEKSYLAMLASRLQLPPQLVTELENQVNALKS